MISLTALITLTFVGPTSLRITVTLAAGPSSSAAAATATGAAAVTSNFSSIAFTRDKKQLKSYYEIDYIIASDVYSPDTTNY